MVHGAPALKSHVAPADFSLAEADHMALPNTKGSEVPSCPASRKIEIMERFDGHHQLLPHSMKCSSCANYIFPQFFLLRIL